MSDEDWSTESCCTIDSEEVEIIMGEEFLKENYIILDRDRPRRRCVVKESRRLHKSENEETETKSFSCDHNRHNFVHSAYLRVYNFVLSLFQFIHLFWTDRENILNEYYQKTKPSNKVRAPDEKMKKICDQQQTVTESLNNNKDSAICEPPKNGDLSGTKKEICQGTSRPKSLPTNNIVYDNCEKRQCATNIVRGKVNSLLLNPVSKPESETPPQTNEKDQSIVSSELIPNKSQPNCFHSSQPSLVFAPPSAINTESLFFCSSKADSSLSSSSRNEPVIVPYVGASRKRSFLGFEDPNDDIEEEETSESKASSEVLVESSFVYMKQAVKYIPVASKNSSLYSSPSLEKQNENDRMSVVEYIEKMQSCNRWVLDSNRNVRINCSENNSANLSYLKHFDNTEERLSGTKRIEDPKTDVQLVNVEPFTPMEIPSRKVSNSQFVSCEAPTLSRCPSVKAEMIDKGSHSSSSLYDEYSARPNRLGKYPVTIKNICFRRNN